MAPASFTPKVKKILKKNNCKFTRQGKGGHEAWYSPITGEKFVVSNNIRSRTTANEILKQAGLKEKV